MILTPTEVLYLRDLEDVIEKYREADDDESKLFNITNARSICEALRALHLARRDESEEKGKDG